MRCENLLPEENLCILLIDEVYIAEKVELNSSGQTIGFTESDEPTKTVLVFMVEFLQNNFSEVIAYLLVRKLTDGS